MAQYIFDASRYVDGVLLSSLGWTVDKNAIDFAVVDLGGGRKVWEQNAGVSDSEISTHIRFSDDMSSNEQEILLLADFTADELVSDYVSLTGGTRHNGGIFASYTYQARVKRTDDANSHHIPGFATIDTNVAPTTLLSEKAMATRMTNTPTGQKARAWAADVGAGLLEAAEPVSWNFESSGQAATALGGVALHADQVSTSPVRISLISIGTGGDPAPYELVEPTVIVPSSLFVDSITTTTANLNWT